jgi:hypothetical protein
MPATRVWVAALAFPVFAFGSVHPQVGHALAGMRFDDLRVVHVATPFRESKTSFKRLSRSGRPRWLIQNSASNLTGHWYGFACGYLSLNSANRRSSALTVRFGVIACPL